MTAPLAPAPETARDQGATQAATQGTTQGAAQGAPDRTETPTARAVSPTVRQTARRSIPWIVLGAIAVLVALFGLLVTGGSSSAGVAMDAGNAGPIGARAVAHVLGQHGVDVHSATTLEQVQDAASDDTTVLVYDPEGNLPSSSYDELTSIASTVVVVEPDFAALQRLAPDVHAAGSPAGTATAGCDISAAQRAERIDPRATDNTADASVPGTFRVDGDATACFTGSGGGASLVETRYDGRTVYLVGSAALFMNDGVSRLGNAALALNLLGAHRTLVWYLPSLLDRPVTGPPDIAALTPGWVTPVVILLVLVFIAAAVWRGRRFGPLVVESLPVVVRAGETREGRARLYQRSSARLRAADALRIGALGRMAALAGLPHTTEAGAIADTVASLTERDRAAVRAALLDAVPGTDAELIALSDTLADLERATAAAVSPASARPTGRMDT